MMVTPAGAQSVGAEAEVLYGNGRDLMSAGKITEACAAFEKSHKLEPAVTTIIALATCREKLGQLANASELFLMAERQTRSASDNVTRQLHTIARDRAAKLEPRVPKLTVKVPYQSKIDELEILRDSVRIPVTMWNRALPIDGGTYTITARVPGAKEWSTTVTLAPEADSKTVGIPDLRNLTSSLEMSSKVPARHKPGAGPRTMMSAPRVSGSGQGGDPSDKQLTPIKENTGRTMLKVGGAGLIGLGVCTGLLVVTNPATGGNENQYVYLAGLTGIALGAAALYFAYPSRGQPAAKKSGMGNSSSGKHKRRKLAIVPQIGPSGGGAGVHFAW